ncbi:MAG TPA: hypothetical protein V6C50_08190, partial [Crinalium sp.]
MSRFHDAIQSCPEHPQYVIQLRDRHPLSTFLVAVETFICGEGSQPTARVDSIGLLHGLWVVQTWAFLTDSTSILSGTT